MGTDALVIPAKKDECSLLKFLEAIGFIYTVAIVFYLIESKGAYGQEIPIYVRNMYIKPFAYFYIVVFSLLAIIPFTILRSIGTPRHTYPASKNKSDNTLFLALFLSLTSGYINMHSIYAIMGPIYYFRDYYFTADSIGNLGTALVAIYPTAYILGLRFWLNSIPEFIGCFLNVINIWVFTILQLRSEPLEIV